MTSYGPIITSETQGTSLSMNHSRNLALSQGKRVQELLRRINKIKKSILKGQLVMTVGTRTMMSRVEGECDICDAL